MDTSPEVGYRFSLKQFSGSASTGDSRGCRTGSAPPRAPSSTHASVVSVRRAQSQIANHPNASSRLFTPKHKQNRVQSSIVNNQQPRNLSALYKGQSSIDIKGRPFSAPVSEEYQSSTCYSSNYRPSATKDTDVLKLPKINKPETPSTPVKQKQNQNGRDIKIEGKDTVEETTPYWFYRSKVKNIKRIDNKSSSADTIKHSIKTVEKFVNNPEEKSVPELQQALEESVDLSHNASPCTQKEPLGVEEDHVDTPYDEAVENDPNKPEKTDDEKTHEDEIQRPTSMIPNIYVYDPVQRRFVVYSTTKPPMNHPEVKNAEILTPPESPREQVDLLRRNHGKGEKRLEVMRSLPLQSEMGKYLWWLHSDKHRHGHFTKSMNRYVPGFFKIYKDVPKKAIIAGESMKKTRVPHPHSAPMLSSRQAVRTYVAQDNVAGGLAPVPQAPQLAGKAVNLNS